MEAALAGCVVLFQEEAHLLYAFVESRGFATGTDAVAQSSNTPAMHAGTGALLFQNDPEFWYEIVRLFGAAEYGGALFGEVVAIARQIESAIDETHVMQFRCAACVVNVHIEKYHVLPNIPVQRLHPVHQCEVHDDGAIYFPSFAI